MRYVVVQICLVCCRRVNCLANHQSILHVFVTFREEGRRMRACAYVVKKYKILWLNGRRPFQYILYTWSSNIIFKNELYNCATTPSSIFSLTLLYSSLLFSEFSSFLSAFSSHLPTEIEDAGMLTL